MKPERPRAERCTISILFFCNHGRWWRMGHYVHGQLLADDTYTCPMCGIKRSTTENAPAKCSHGFDAKHCVSCRHERRRMGPYDP